MILSLFGPDNIGRKAYREKVQRYAIEKKSIWEDVKYGVIFGSQDFVDRVKKDYLSGEYQADIPVKKKFVDDRDLGRIVKTAAAVMMIDIQKLRSSRRISKPDITDRDMLVYHLWQSGRFSNSEIGNQVGLTTSSVSRRVGIFRDLLDGDKKLQTKYEKFKSIIKV